MRRSPLLHAARAALAGFFACSTAHASLRFWNGGGADNFWSTPGNWAAFFGVPANDGTDDIIMQGTLQPGSLVDVAYDINSLQFSGGGGAGAFTLYGGLLTIGSGGVINNDADFQQIHNNIALDANQTWTSAAGQLIFQGNVTLGSLTSRTLTIDTIFQTQLHGVLSNAVIGSGALIKNGTGRLLMGGQPNTYTGLTRVNSGTLFLQKDNVSGDGGAIRGDLIIGNGVDMALVETGVGNPQIADTSNVTVNALGHLDLVGNTDTFRSLTLNAGIASLSFTTLTNSLTMSGGTLHLGGGSITVGAGITMTAGSILGPGWVPLTGNIVTNASATQSLIEPVLRPNGTSTLNIADGAAVNDLNLNGGVQGGTLIKTGDGQLRVAGPAFGGANVTSFQVNSGTLVMAATSVTPDTTRLVTVGDGFGVDAVEYAAGNQVNLGSLIVGSSGVVRLNGFNDVVTQVHLSAGQITTGSGSLDVQTLLRTFAASATSSITGKLIVKDLQVADGPAADDLNLDAAVTFNGSVISGGGRIVLSGSAANVGAASLSGGELALNKSIADGALSGDVSITNGTLRWRASDQVLDTSGSTTFTTTLAAGLLDLDGFSDTIGHLITTGSQVTTDGGVLTVNGNVTSLSSAQPSTLSGVLSLGGATRMYSVADGAASIDLDVPAIVSDGALTKQGTGVLRLGGNNTFTGATTLQAGMLQLGHDSALGSGSFVIAGGIVQASGAARSLANSVFATDDCTIGGDLGLTFAGPFNLSNLRTITKSGGGTFTLSGPQTHGVNTTINVADGALRLVSDAGAGGANLTVNLNGSGSRVEFGSTQHLAAINVNAGTALLQPTGNKALVTKGLTVDTTDAFIDVWEHAVIIDYTGGSPLTSIQSAILSAYNVGSWDGFGITSSLADASTFAVGYGEAAALGLTSFEGESLDGPALLVKYTYYGDANLDGRVNVADLVMLASNWKTSGLWTEGDFNYDGFIDKVDLGLMALNWYAGNITPLGPALEALGLPTSVPEPAHLAGFLIAAGILPRHRRRNQALFQFP